MEKNKRNKIIGLSIGILVVLIIVVSSTYAYWQITKTQKTPNDIVAACLSLDLNDASAENTGINLDSAWPISDEEGASLTGYTFTVTNNCSEEINYIVGLNRVEEESANYLLDSSIRLQLDDNSAFTYSDLTDVEYRDSGNTYTSRISKQVSVVTISANSTNTHTIRVWVSESAPVFEQSKTFLGQVFITGGEGIEVPENSSCFTIADNGTILGYNYECGTNVVVPAEVNEIQVKSINAASFNNTSVFNIYGEYGEDNGSGSYEYTDEFYYLKQLPIELENSTITTKDEFVAALESYQCGSKTSCSFNADELQIIIGLEEYNAIDWLKYVEIRHMSEGMGETIALNFAQSLDLSDAIYLERIGEDSFDEHGLENVSFPLNGVLSFIEYSAFGNNKITEIIIPDSVKMLDDFAFTNNNISSLKFDGIKLII